MSITIKEIASVKGQGFLNNRGTDCFSGRVIPVGCVFRAEELMAVSQCAARYGNGKIAFTSRMTAELPGIPFAKIPEAQAFLAEYGLHFGGTGAKIRPVVACKGTTCVYGCYDTQALAKTMHETYFVGWSDFALPHKFKIGIGGCPNSCIKPSLNDFGIEGHKPPAYTPADCRGCKRCQVEVSCPSKAVSMQEGKMQIAESQCRNCGVCITKCPFGAVKAPPAPLFQIYLGGTWGKICRVGTPLPFLVTEAEIFPLLEATLHWFQENGREKERLGMAIDRLGEAAIFAAILPQRAGGETHEIHS